MTRTSDLIQTFQPQWKNKHSEDCAVTKERASLWASFVADPTNGALHGAVIEYDGGGDQEIENCTCGRFGTRRGSEPLDPLKYGTYLSIQARALAVHLDAFVDLVARDVNTHDGNEWGSGWREGAEYASAGSLTHEAYRLRQLANLWDDG